MATALWKVVLLALAYQGRALPDGQCHEDGSGESCGQEPLRGGDGFVQAAALTQKKISGQVGMADADDILSFVQGLNSSGAESPSMLSVLNFAESTAEKVVNQGYRMTPVETQALQALKDYIKTTLETAKVTHDEDQAEVNSARDSIQGCTDKASNLLSGDVAGLGRTLTMNREAHATCRTSEAAKQDEMSSVCSPYQTYLSNEANRIPPDCVTKLSNNFIDPNDASQRSTLVECFKAAQAWLTPLHDQSIACETKTRSLTEQNAQCNTKQSTLEQSSCAYGSKLDDVCADQTTCRTSTVAARESAHARVAVSESSRKAEYAAGQHATCYFTVLEAIEADKAQTFKECADLTVTTSQFDISFPAVPKEVSCETESSKTCDAVWQSSEYKIKSWFSKVTTATCQSCPTPAPPTPPPTPAPPAPEEASFRYFEFTVVQTGTGAHICIDNMRVESSGEMHYPQSVSDNGFSHDYGDIGAQWASGSNKHWCGWSTDGGGANLVLDMGKALSGVTNYAFKVHGAVCGNDPRKWSWRASSDGQTWTSLGDTVAYDCNSLNHAGGWNEFDFPQAPTAAPEATTGGAKYVEGAAGSHDCPAGYENIMTLDECNEAAPAVGKEYARNAAASHERPRGCFAWHTTKTWLWFNTLSVDPNNPHSGGTPICKQAPTPAPAPEADFTYSWSGQATFEQRTVVDGLSAWSDRSYTFTQIPSEMLGAQFFAGPHYLSPGTLTVSTSPGGAVYIYSLVAHSGCNANRDGGFPSLAWSGIGMMVGQNWGSCRLNVWKRVLAPGETLEIPIAQPSGQGAMSGGFAFQAQAPTQAAVAMVVATSTGPECPAGSVVMSEAECQDAAIKEGFGRNPVPVDSTECPPGCFADSSEPTYWWYNSNPTGGGRRRGRYAVCKEA